LILALPFLIVVGLVLPLLSWSSYRRSLRAEPAPDATVSIRAMAIQIFIVQALVLGLALVASGAADLDLAWSSTLTVATVLSAGVAIAGAVFVAWLEARRPLGPHDTLRRKLRQVSASDPVWIAITVVAGSVGEYAYRGVLTAILTGPLGIGPAALASAGLFGLAHLGSGWRSAAFGVGFALAMQALILFSGGLLPAVLAHAAYDLIAARLGHRLAKRQAETTTA
jgi:membrane protease YdiL (CAAX protease family)